MMKREKRGSNKKALIIITKELKTPRRPPKEIRGPCV